MQTFTVTIKEIVDETHDTKTFTTIRPDSFDFSPGQYCLFWLEGFSRPRPFTIASTPEQDHLDFTIKKIGEFTNALFKLKTGDSLKITLPKDSKLSIKEPPSDRIVFIAGGSGITPFYPSIKSFASRSDMTLLYSNRTENDIIFRKQFEELAQQNDSLDIKFFITHQPDTIYTHKRIDKDDLKSVMSEHTQWYICGPPGMTEAIVEQLAELDVSEENIHKEAWELPSKHDDE
ncbi:MAG: ferredoxin--NADP reductase [Nanobdellota archaeon]